MAKCGKIGKCLPYMSQHSGFALLFSGILYESTFRQSELHTSMTSAAWLDKDSLRNLSTRFLSGNPMARGTDAFFVSKSPIPKFFVRLKMFQENV